MSRFTPGMDITEKAAALSDGIPGGLVVAMQLGALDSYYLQLLDELDITGEAIYMLHNDVCGRDLGKTSLMLVACHAEILDRDKLMHAINNRGAGVDVVVVANKLYEIADSNPVVRSMFKRR